MDIYNLTDEYFFSFYIGSNVFVDNKSTYIGLTLDEEIEESRRKLR